jgi:hypothetical protein
MKKRVWMLVSTALGNTPALAKKTSIVHGTSHLTDGAYESLKVNGSLTFSGLTITDALVTNGSIRGKNLTCRTIHANGAFNVDGFQAQDVKSNGTFSAENVDITGNAEFNGDLKITHGTLACITLSGTHPILVDTKIKRNIHIKKVNNGCSFFGFLFHQSSVQILTLKRKTLIEGNVVFEESGEVHFFDAAKVKGKILNGKVIQT